MVGCRFVVQPNASYFPMLCSVLFFGKTHLHINTRIYYTNHLSFASDIVEIQGMVKMVPFGLWIEVELNP